MKYKRNSVLFLAEISVRFLCGGILLVGKVTCWNLVLTMSHFYFYSFLGKLGLVDEFSIMGVILCLGFSCKVLFYFIIF